MFMIPLGIDAAALIIIFTVQFIGVIYSCIRICMFASSIVIIRGKGVIAHKVYRFSATAACQPQIVGVLIVLPSCTTPYTRLFWLYVCMTLFASGASGGGGDPGHWLHGSWRPAAGGVKGVPGKCPCHSL